MADGDFGQRLELALKALNISRGRLASDARVDKSLVSRWLRGLSTPRGHNLEAVTATIRAAVPDFNQLSWTLPLEAFNRLVAGASTASPAPAPPASAPAALFCATEADREAARLRARAYEGFWRVTHPSLVHPGVLMNQYARIRREADDLLHLRVVYARMGWSGPLMTVNDQLFGITRDEVDNTFAFFLFQGVVHPRALLLDGMVLVPAKSPTRDLSACPYLMERIGELSNDRDADDAMLESLRERPLQAEGVSDDLRRHLVRRAEPADGDAILRLSLAISRSLGVS